MAISIFFYINRLVFNAYHRKTGRVSASILPIIALLLSLEGVHAATTIDRENKATYKTIVNDSIANLKANMTRPIGYDQPRHWFISIFPAPVKVKAGSLAPGDVHHMRFIYKKWFFTNAHEGQLNLRIDAVGDDFVATTITENTSYLASYMAIDGTRVQFADLGGGRTEISLTVFYKRRLDPV